MGEVRTRRLLPRAVARRLALVVAVVALGAGLAVQHQPGHAGAAVRTAVYGGGEMMAADPVGGYWTSSPGGAVTPHGGSPAFGSPAQSGLALTRPIVGMSPTADGAGYWLVASDGGIFSYGDAQFHGSTGAIRLNLPIVGMSATADGAGYWLVASDGGIFSYGDARFYGSTGALHLNRPIVGMAPTPDGAGYWLVASDGGIFSFGDAGYFGSTGALRLNQPIVAMAPTPDGGGYWLVATDGGVFTFGDAGYYGSTAGTGTSALGVVIDPSGSGYSLVESDGTSVSFGGDNTVAQSANPTDGAPTLPPPTTTTTAPPSTTTTTTPPDTTTTTATPDTTTTTTPDTTTTTTTPPPPPTLLQGAYVPNANPAGLSSFAAATRTSPTIATDYLPGGSGWSGMDGAGGSLNWLLGPWERSGYTLSLGVPIVPTQNGAPVATLAQGATGAYDSSYVTLAQTLVDAGQANAYLRLGWEFDGSWMLWAAQSPAAEANYAAYFAQIVTAMRSVPGEAFRFVWNPDAGAFTTPGYSVAAAYPGDAYVDVIGLDAYDQTWATPQTPSNAWSSTTLPSLVAAQQFASAHAKPLALAEWGLAIRSDGHGLGDDPFYIDQMVSWMQNASNNVAYESYFDCNSGGVNSLITGGSFPASLARFAVDL